MNEPTIKEYVLGNITITQKGKEGEHFAFHVAIDGKELSMCASTLDRAIVVALAHKYDDSMHTASYACRVLNMPEAVYTD
jgi:hypothetical protein